MTRTKEAEMRRCVSEGEETQERPRQGETRKRRHESDEGEASAREERNDLWGGEKSGQSEKFLTSIKAKGKNRETGDEEKELKIE